MLLALYTCLAMYFMFLNYFGRKSKIPVETVVHMEFIAIETRWPWKKFLIVWPLAYKIMQKAFFLMGLYFTDVFTYVCMCLHDVQYIICVNAWLIDWFTVLIFRILTLVLLNLDIPCLCKQKKPTDMDLHCLPFSMWIYISYLE